MARWIEYICVFEKCSPVSNRNIVHAYAPVLQVAIVEVLISEIFSKIQRKERSKFGHELLAV